MKSLIVVFFFILPSLLFAQNIEVSGRVNGIWEADTVFVNDHIFISPGEKLEVMPGTFVQFRGPYRFMVSGELKACGNPTDTIFFCINDTTGFANKSNAEGGWNGIRLINIEEDADSSLLDYCSFSYGKAVNESDTSFDFGGAIYAQGFDKIRISHCRFFRNYARRNGGGVYLYSCDAVISNNTFENNDCGSQDPPYGYGGALSMDYSESITGWNTFNNNASSGIGGALSLRFKDAEIHHNIFKNNYSALGGAIGILHIDSCHHIIHNNLIYNNSCLFFGGGVSNNDASPVWVNNTIINNYSEGYGGGFYCKDSICPSVYNTLIWGNQCASGWGDQVYLWDLYSQSDFYFCLIEGGKEDFAGTGSGEAFTGEWISMLDEEPLIDMQTSPPCRLLPDSPCINTGNPDTSGLKIPETDILGSARIFNSRIDIGASEWENLGINPKQAMPEISYFPNPTTEYINIQSYTNISALYIFDISGSLLLNIKPDSKSYMLNLKGLNKGIYLLKIESPSHNAVKKIILQ